MSYSKQRLDKCWYDGKIEAIRPHVGVKYYRASTRKAMSILIPTRLLFRAICKQCKHASIYDWEQITPEEYQHAMVNAAIQE
jgi:hypothetical protein